MEREMREGTGGKILSLRAALCAATVELFLDYATHCRGKKLHCRELSRYVRCTGWPC